MWKRRLWKRRERGDASPRRERSSRRAVAARGADGLPKPLRKALDASPRDVSAFAERFEIRGDVARGGMGHVLRVFDRVMEREVALKRFSPDADDLRQCLEEAQITGQLSHPHIVPVHEVGLDSRDRTVFFTMPLLDGCTLADEIARYHEGAAAPDALARLLGIVLKVCNALAFAHERGVLHCDVKPHNVMVGSHGEVHLLDWGLARTREPHGTRREYAPIGGSPAYMAPEQHGLEAERVGPWTDVFGIGGLLYQILTGRGPFGRRTGSDAASGPSRRESVPPPDSQASGRDLPPRLCEIAMRALAANPADRHASVADLTRDLRDFLDGGGAWLATRRFEAGEALLREGEAPGVAYLLTEGRVQVHREGPRGRERVRSIGPGEIVGEMALVTGRPRSASAVATEAGEARVITRAAWTGELSTEWSRALVIALADRFHALDSEVRARSRG